MGLEIKQKGSPWKGGHAAWSIQGADVVEITERVCWNGSELALVSEHPLALLPGDSISSAVKFTHLERLSVGRIRNSTCYTADIPWWYSCFLTLFFSGPTSSENKETLASPEAQNSCFGSKGNHCSSFAVVKFSTIEWRTGKELCTGFDEYEDTPMLKMVANM